MQPDAIRPFPASAGHLPTNQEHLACWYINKSYLTIYLEVKNIDSGSSKQAMRGEKS